jgi:hypothetical protein
MDNYMDWGSYETKIHQKKLSKNMENPEDNTAWSTAGTNQQRV